VAFAAGAGLRDLGRRMNIPAGTVLARAKREGWSRQVEQAKALVPAAAGTVSPFDAVNASLAEASTQTRAMLAQALLHAAGQARKTKHPLERSRQIRNVAAASAQVHGWESKTSVKVSGTVQHVLSAEERARRLQRIIEQRARAKVIDNQDVA